MRIYLVIIILMFLVIALLWRLFQYKRQMRSFTEAVGRLTEEDSMQNVTVDYFGGDIVALADALNKYTEQQREHLLCYEKDRRLLEHLIAGISHDFRTPLTAGIGYMQMIEKSGELSDKNREYLMTALGKLSDLKQSSDDFFELSLMDNADTELEWEEVNLNNLLAECILEQHSWLEASGLSVEFELPADDIIISGDAHSLKRIMDNLFSNARKYAVSFLHLKVMADAENSILISMENDMEDSASMEGDRIFGAFYRGSSRHRQGNGLGLFVVKTLAERIGYEVRADGSDSIFRIELLIRCDSHVKIAK